MLALAGCEIAVIKDLGRWASDVVLRYVLDAPLLQRSKSLASAMFNSTAQTVFGKTQLNPKPEVDDLINVWFPDQDSLCDGTWVQGKVRSTKETGSNQSFLLALTDAEPKVKNKQFAVSESCVEVPFNESTQWVCDTQFVYPTSCGLEDRRYRNYWDVRGYACRRCPIVGLTLSQNKACDFLKSVGP